MYGDDPIPAAAAEIHAQRLVEVRRLLDELSRREVLALAASATPPSHIRWANVGPDSGLTEDQEDFIDYWTPELVLAECREKRELICALDEWALTVGSPSDQQFVNRLISLLATSKDR